MKCLPITNKQPTWTNYRTTVNDSRGGLLYTLAGFIWLGLKRKGESKEVIAHIRVGLIADRRSHIIGG